jgi:hypothetical protein
MKLSEFAARVQASDVLSKASFGVADGSLCIVGEKGDGKYWHVPVFPVGAAVFGASLAALIDAGFARAESEASRWVMPAGPVEG